ncbi:uncharacterized protein LOC121966965%2C partial [Scomber scombrus]|uniref:Uncharacterized protein LOC121966965, partial n=1 Tax=Scomber scombrus TaxID=13677 RepID=A0AAV1QJ40_SCOSC
MSVWTWRLLLFLLSAGSSLDAVDVNWLTNTVRVILGEYRIKGQFCLAANIPPNLTPEQLLQVLQTERNNEDVNGIVSGSVVYKRPHVIVAKPAGPKHAEHLVLKEILQPPFSRNRQGNVLLIFSHLSPCDMCTSDILKYLKPDVLNKWSDHAFVFDTVFNKPKSGGSRTREQVKESLKQLGNSGLGLRNIFRCYEPTDSLECHSCSSQGRVSKVCIDNESMSQQGGSSSSRSRSSSSSRSRSRSSSSEGRYRSSSSEGRYRSSSSEGRNRSISSRSRSSSSEGRYRSSSRSRKRGRYRSESRDRSRKRSSSRSSRNRG